ncbi:hypothetical protein D6783_00375 [Candidatus Woesearchaeota archaeon]|nr:MAG: hypothetical protein D6783_00375 [Candidatus Woesearchaeota archaeon]
MSLLYEVVLERYLKTKTSWRRAGGGKDVVTTVLLFKRSLGVSFFSTIVFPEYNVNVVWITIGNILGARCVWLFSNAQAVKAAVSSPLLKRKVFKDGVVHSISEFTQCFALNVKKKPLRGVVR